jgi:glutamate transport system ATP-binding protein
VSITESAVPIIQIHGLSKWFGKNQVLENIDLGVAAGEVVVVIGPSGSGKSTLCRCVNRLERYEHGEILIDGQLLPDEGKQLARLRAEVGMVFQSFNLFAHMSVLQNVMLGPIKTLGLSRDVAKERALALLGRVGIADKVDHYPAELSGGQQQRVAIARALAMQPKVMHEMGFARRAADRVVFMADGRIVESGTPEHFFDNPETERARSFLSSILHH